MVNVRKKILGRRIRMVGVSAFARECGVSRTTVYNWIGKPAILPAQALATLAKMSNKPIEFFMEKDS